MNENLRAVTLTYSRKSMQNITNTISTRAPAASPSLKRMLDPVDEDDASHEDEVSVPRVIRSYSLPSHLDMADSVVEGANSRKKPRHNDAKNKPCRLRSIVRHGKIENIRLLIKRIKAAEGRSPVAMSGQMFHLYGGPEGAGSFGDWLKAMEFEEYVKGEQMYFFIDTKKVSILVYPAVGRSHETLMCSDENPPSNIVQHEVLERAEAPQREPAEGWTIRHRRSPPTQPAEHQWDPSNHS